MALPRYRDIREAIAASVWTADEIEHERAVWPALGGLPKWAHDPDVGLVERSYVIPDGGYPPNEDARGEWHTLPRPAGQGGRAVAGTIGPDGARVRRAGGDGVPRINTYGDSYTHGEQVDDTETWQEYLADDLGEPIRNFGLSGGSVYQTHLRMVKEESGANEAPYILFYLWGDDHLRSIRGWFLDVVNCRRFRLAVGNPSIGWDRGGRRLVERATWIPDPDSLARLGDVEWLTDRFGDDVVTQLFLFAGSPFYGTDAERDERLQRFLDPVRIGEVDNARVGELAEWLGVAWTGGSAAEAHAVEDALSLRASIHVIDKARRFAEESGKRIMFLLLDPFRAMREMLDRGIRYDQAIVDHLDATGASYFDMTRYHYAEIRSPGGSYERYLERFFVDGAGHYSPAGNRYFASALRPRLQDWMA
jgi:hypothetical protein